MIATKLVAGNWQLVKNKDIPSQRDGLDCGVFMLMYALYITFEWSFDFTQNDMPYIRECWLNLVLKCMCHKREASRSIKWTTCMVVPRTMGFLRYNVRVSSNCTFLEILTLSILVFVFLVQGVCGFYTILTSPVSRSPC